MTRSIAEAVAERFGQPLIRRVVAANAVSESLLHDEWFEPLSKLCGATVDGVERVTAAAVFAHLKVPTEQRKHVFFRVSKLMQATGWLPTKVRADDGEYVRGYERRPKPPTVPPARHGSDHNGCCSAWRRHPA
jgi:hypothetical protein